MTVLVKFTNSDKDEGTERCGKLRILMGVFLTSFKIRKTFKEVTYNREEKQNYQLICCATMCVDVAGRELEGRGLAGRGNSVRRKPEVESENAVRSV